MAHKPELELLDRVVDSFNFQLALGGFYVGCNCRECDALRPLYEANEKIKEACYILLGSGAQAQGEAQVRAEGVAEGEGPPALPHHS